MNSITNLYSTIPEQRRLHIYECMKTFNKNFQKSENITMAATRNKIGIPVHLTAIIMSLGNFISDLYWHNNANIENLLFAKLNYDLIPFINNINKKKAAAFLQYLKKNNITDEKELTYAIREYLFNAGSGYYSILHPNKIKRLAKTGSYERSFETGVFAFRTDKKDLYHEFQRWVLSKTQKAKCKA